MLGESEYLIPTAAVAFSHLFLAPTHSLFTLVALQLLTIAWIVGYAAVALSHSTVWANAFTVGITGIRCFSLFHVPGITAFCLFLFAPAFLFGRYITLRVEQLPPITGSLQTLHSLLLFWPCGYIVWLALPSTRRAKEPISL
jgi:hypothetical protein